jgi:hypothetical protein
VRKCDSPKPANRGRDCYGDSRRERPCSQPVDGGWSDWYLRDLECRYGQMTWYRDCNNPVPSNGGRTCYGRRTKTESCSDPVDGGWGEWRDEGSCSYGRQTQVRRCDSPKPANGGRDCYGKSERTVPCDQGGALCECTSLTLWDERTSQNIGNCLTSTRGKGYWCYVASTSECSDKKASSRSKGLYYSYRACDKHDPQPIASPNHPRRMNQ